MSTLFFILAFLMAGFFPARAGERSGPNPGNISPSGAADASLFTGAFTYAFPISLPPGRNGVAPSLGLGYSSQADNGWLGIGWDLSLGAIQRSTKGGLPTYDDIKDTFTFTLAGENQELVCIAQGTDANGAFREFRSKIESGFTRFRYYGTDKVWRAWAKDGRRYDFLGLLQHAASGQFFYWGLTQVTDTEGNYMAVSYSTSGVSGLLPSLPQAVHYTGHVGTGLAPGYDVLFGYEVRPDTMTDFMPGIEQILAHRLSFIEVRNRGILVRRYQLSYAQNAAGGSLLSSIQLVASDGSSLPPTTFSYSQTNSAYGPLAPWTMADADPWPVSFTASDGSMNVKLMDVNGDGLPDHVYKDLSMHDHFLVRLNTGSGFGPEQSWMVPVGDDDPWPVSFMASDGSVNVDLLDINGDGLPDHVYKDLGMHDRFWVRLNTGSGFGPAQAWMIPPGDDDPWPVGFRANTGAFNVQMLDINGDGLPDHVYKDLYMHDRFWVRLNTGSGFGAAQAWMVPSGDDDPWPVSFIASDGSMNVELLDINGDGLPDHVYKDLLMHDRFWVRMNTGTGFGPAQAWMVPPGDDDPWPVSFTASDGSVNVDMVDVNKDGLPDHVYKDLGMHDHFSVRLNTGRGFGPVQSWPVPAGEDDPWPESFRAIDGSINVGMEDINGDGVPDHVYKDLYQSGFSIRLNQDATGDLLKTIKSPLGGTVLVSYAVQPPISARCPFPVTVVQSVSTNDGMGSTVTVNYSFSGALYDRARDKKEFLGFQTSAVTDALGNKTVTTFGQNDGAVNDVNIYKGQVEKVETFDAAGNSLARTVNTLSYAQPFTGVYFPFVSRTDSYQLGAVGSKQTAVEYAYDAYGNITQVTNRGDVSDSSDDQTTLTDYAYNTGSYLVAYPTRVRLQDALGNTIRQSWTYYDNATDWATPPTTGNPTKSGSWLNGGNDLAVTRTFDAYGNVTDQYDALWNATSGSQGNHIQTTYDATLHQYPTQVTNALGQSVSASYDPGTGQVLVSTDANGRATSYQYDVFGRVSKVIGPLDSATYPTVSYTYAINTVPPHAVVESRPVDHGQATALDSYSFLDGLGRPIQSKTSFPGGNQLVGGMRSYNSRGMVERVYQDFVVSVSTTLSSLPGGTKFSSSTYDALGRVTQVWNPDGTTAQTAFQDWQETVTDPNGHQKVYARDAYGRIIRVDELINGNTQSTYYQYDPSGNLTQITNAKSQVTSVSYDTLFRKTDMTDPQMGHWSYAYDADGALIRQTDALLNVSSMTYDRLGRLQTKISPTGTESYTYDTGTDGIGRLAQVVDHNGYTHQYTYDALGELTVKTRTIDGVVYVTSTSYDAAGREKDLVYPDGFAVKSVYDGAAQTRVDKGDGSFTYATLAYDNAGTGKLKTLTLGNGAVTTYGYSPVTQRLTSLVTTAGGQTIQNLGYAFDNAGNITGITDAVDSSQSQSFTYDHLDRLIQAVGGYGTKQYLYDELGNQLTTPERPDTYNTYETPLSYSSHVVTVPNGRWGSGLYLDGQGSATIPGAGSVGGETALTVELWARVLASGSGYLMTKPGVFSFPKFNADGTVDGAVVVNGSSVTVHVATTTVLNAWKHYAITYDGAAVKVYINGQLAAQTAATGTTGVNANPVTAGGGFQGLVDDFYAYNRTAPQSELQTRYASAPNFAPNQPTTPATVPSGITGAVAGSSVTFQFQAWDLDGDQIKYRIDWGDGNIQDTAYVNSGVVSQATHTWAAGGNYTITVKAVQQDGTQGALSPGYVMAVGTVGGSKLENGLTIGASMAMMSTTSTVAGLTAGEAAVILSTSAGNRVKWGTALAPLNPSAWGIFGLGSQGTGGGEPVPPTKSGLDSLLVLQGTTTAQVTQITDGLKSRPDLEQKDANGNLRISNGRWILYDAENRPIRVVTADGTKTEYAYDYSGVRVKKVVTPSGGSATTTIYVDLYETTGGVGTDYILAGPQPIAMKTGGTVTYLHTDNLGSTSLMTNSAGTVVRTNKYTPFGSVWQTSGSVDNDHRFTGHRSDDSVGWIFMQNRFYDPSSGRFVTPDTIVGNPYAPQLLNRYAYCQNNPVNYTDPTGHLHFKLSNFLGAAVPFVGGLSFTVNHWNAAAMWDRNRSAVINGGIAFVLSGFNPVAGIASFGSTEFLQSHTGQHVVGETAKGLYKNHLMGRREAQIFSEVAWYTAATFSIEKGLASMSGGLESERPFDAENDRGLVDNGGGEHLGRSGQDLFNDSANVGRDPMVTLTAQNGNQAVVGYGDAFEQRWLGSMGVTHVSSLTSNLTTSAEGPWYSYLTRGTCAQYANSNLLAGGFGATTVTGFGRVTSLIYGNYGGQLWSKIAYSAWESEKRW